MKLKKPCLLWQGATNNKGYGLVNLKTDGKWKTQLAHRVAYAKAHPKEDISKVLILHKCDVRKCTEPTHLFTGTALENTRDMINKGRMKHASGENASKAKLTWDQVREIRRIYAIGARGTLKQLCKTFDISKGAMVSIVKNRTWRNV